MDSEVPGASGSFSEQDFYLAEFRGRSLALALASPALCRPEALDRVLALLRVNSTRVLLFASGAEAFDRHGVATVVDAGDPDWLQALWRASQREPVIGMLLPDASALADTCARAVGRLRLAKLVWIDERGPLAGEDGQRVSFADRSELARLIGSPHIDRDGSRGALLNSIARMIDEGLPSAAITDSVGLMDELFTFAGAGTFFARERYLDVRWLGLDEFAAAGELVRRGVEEGFLIERSGADLERVMANSFGVFVERRYLAGIGALLPHSEDGAGEIASLYTLTRFVGEGVGGHLVEFAMARACDAGHRFVFACTTQEHVERFFLRNGFDRVGPESIPPAKWKGYSAERRSRVRCLRRDVAPKP